MMMIVLHSTERAVAPFRQTLLIISIRYQERTDIHPQ